MPRPSRSLPAGHSFHITLHCNSRQFLIAKRIRRDVLLVVLEKAKQKYQFRLYGVCLMANHIHRTRIDRAKPRSYPVVGLALYRY
jgi:REP element-mobilizing transposase RayT